MVLSAAVRKERLSELLAHSEKAIAQQRLYYRGITQSFDVYRIDLDWLIYNRHNGRLEAEMLTWEQEHSISPEHYDDALHKLIENFLWQSNTARNKQTLADLEKKQQQRFAIVSLDGVIIDGNRRAMLLRRLEERKGKQYLDAIILPDAYDENQKEIVRLETQYQLGEDAKLEYGPLQKYLHARRLHDLDIPDAEIDQLMGEGPGTAARLLETLRLMDEYLEHIGCPRLYTMLKDDGGTKEGMFVDLAGDLRRLRGPTNRVEWAFDEMEPLHLQLIQFDYIRLGEFQDAKKSYREISHQSKGKNFFANREIWEVFRDKHMRDVFPHSTKFGNLEEYMAAHPGHDSKVDAARARDQDWREEVRGAMLENFGRSSTKLDYKVNELQPREYLERAKLALEKVNVDSPGFLSDPENSRLVMDVNRLSFEMKKKLERARQA